MSVKTWVTASAVAATLSIGAAQAAVIDFGNQPGNYTPYTEDGFSFDQASLDNSGGNCPFNDPACLKLNSGQGGGSAQTVMTQIGGGLFDVLSFSYEFSGNAAFNQLVISALGYADVILEVGVNGILKDTSYVWSGPAFLNVSSVTFTSTNGGTVRIDDIATTAAVPVPAAGGLLVVGLGALAAAKRRRKAA